MSHIFAYVSGDRVCGCVTRAADGTFAGRGRGLERLAQARAIMAVDEETEEADVSGGLLMMQPTISAGSDIEAMLNGAAEVACLFFFSLCSRVPYQIHIVYSLLPDLLIRRVSMS